MLKERDKKLLFYSWSYGILAASIIYACCGYGALAYTIFSNSYDISWEYSSGPAEHNMTIYSNVSDYTYPTNKIYLQWSMNYNGAGYASICGGKYMGLWWCDDIYGTSNCSIAYPDRVESSCSNIRDWKNGFSDISKPTTSNQYLIAGLSSTNDDTTPDEVLWSSSYAPQDSLVTAPVINDFTKDATCYSPGEAIVLESDVTGDVDSWLWEIYDSNDVSVWSSTDSVETIVDENFAPGLYQVQLYVENTAGSDFLSKDNWLNITQAGGCGPAANWTNPFPTQVTTVPTQQFYETMTMPPHIVTNMTGINEEINKGMFANMSQGYRDYFDYVGEQANTTFTGTFRTLLSPVSLVVNAIAYAISLFSTSINALTVYTTVPLAITAIVINYMPWQIVTLITAGIAIDAILIIIIGR